MRKILRTLLEPPLPLISTIHNLTLIRGLLERKGGKRKLRLIYFISYRSTVTKDLSSNLNKQDLQLAFSLC